MLHFSLFYWQGRIENIGSFDELAASGKAFSMLLTSLQEKDKDGDSLSAKVRNIFLNNVRCFYSSYNCLFNYLNYVRRNDLPRAINYA